jgi:parvulin-like peptidyl-prolyl isomerase
MKLKLFSLLLALSMLSFLLVVGRSEAVAEPTLTGMAVARVNGVEIGQKQLDHYFADYLQAQGRMVASIRNPVAYNRLRSAALDDLIDKELLWQEASKRGIEVDEKAVQDNFTALRAEFTSEEIFNRRLEEAGFDTQSFVQYLRRELISQRMLEQLSRFNEPQDEEVLAYYLSQAPRIHARHILLKLDPQADSGTVEAARLKLLALRERIVNGADFAGIARQYSEDSQAAEGGDLGYFSRDSTVPGLTDAATDVAFGLAPGTISEPVRTIYGWHLLKVETTVSATASATAFSGDIQGIAMARRALDQQRQRLATREALVNLRASSTIEKPGER